ncbi:OmpH family outer membrane protein [Sphingomonas oryzagri]|uniref:OmpH family outer membrane protein n=1 Tax=Sphingomonas oryzagri TaxID=3042314 RepID=A0ABT6MXA6_9SPHN|nr:OmpH family outer membrane protein [Sphingomonas oryzagri]MDH7637680.1 OmpH family outer membrane protein [Sphingomonas oryzagri]
MKPFAFLVLSIAPLHPFAAQADVPPQPASGLGGTPVAGLCMLSRPAVFANSKVGIAAGERLKELTQQADAELAPDRKALEAERQALADQAGKLSPSDRQARVQAVEQHARALQAKAEQRNRELEATKVKVIEQIGASMQPIVAQIYKARGCGLLLDRGSVIGGNMANDLTPQVVQALDTKISAISFNREVLTGAGDGKP